MAKIILGPNDITNLLKGHPDAELVLINKAVEQVADGMSRKVTKELVEKRVGELMDHLLTENVGWNKRKLAPQLEALVKTCVREASDELFKDKTGQQVMDAVRIEARRQMEVSARDLANTMRQEIRGMIREEIRVMLGSKDS
jgi:hypothetical protein